MQLIFFLPALALGISELCQMVTFDPEFYPTQAALVSEIQYLGGWDAVKAAYDGRNDEMRDRVFFRQEYVLNLLTSLKNQGLQITWPKKIPGSRTLTSDFDITISVSPGASVSSMWDDVKAARLFNSKIKEVFHASPAKTFDTNIYVRDFSPIGDYDSLSDKSNQIVAALTKVRRYMNAAEWNHFSASVENNFYSSWHYHPGNRNHQHSMSVRFRHSMMHLDDADIKYIFSIKKIYEKLHEGTYNLNWQSMPFLDDDYTMQFMLRDIASTDPDKVLDAEYALYLEGMEEVRSKQFELEMLRAENASPYEIIALKETIKRLVTDAVIFAPEAYSSAGGFFHIVKYEQSGKSEVVWNRLTHFDLFCSANEQVGDFLKDVNYHFEGDVETALFQSSKYLMRFYDAVQNINRKIGESYQHASDMDLSVYQVQLSDPAGRKMKLEIFKQAVAQLFQIRRSSISKEEKRMKTRVIHETTAFRDLFGRNMVEVQMTVMSHLAQLTAEYQVLFETRPSMDIQYV